MVSVVRTSSPSQRHIDIGGRVRSVRLRRKLRQVDLAASAGLSWRHLIRIEQGEGGEPKPETIDRLAEALGVDSDELLGDDDGEPRSSMSLDDFLRARIAELLREQVRA